MQLRGLFGRRLGALVAATTLATASAAAITFAAPASADPGPIAQRDASTGMTADALPTVQLDDGVVWSIAVSNGIAYVGGEFSNMRPAGAAKGTNLIPRTNLAAVNLSTGALVSSWAPSVNAQVKAVAVSPDGSRVYVGGSFTQANGVARSRIAAFSTSTGALITSFAASVNASVNAIAATNSTVYVGGVFNGANGQTRTRLAAFSAATGQLLNWAPTADNDVDALLVTPDQSRVIVGGAFANVNGAQARGSAALDATTGASLPWAINNIAYSYNTKVGGAILSLTTDGTAVYGSAWNYGSPSNFEGVFSVDPNTGNVNWIEDCHGDSYDTFPMSGVVYVVSHEHFCSNVGAFPETNPRSWHRTTAFTAAATGTLTANQESGTGYGNFAGEPSPSQINWYPDLVAGTYTKQYQAAWAVSGNSKYLIEGGEFPSVNGTPQYGLVRFGVSSVAPDKQGPQDGSSAINPNVLVTSSNTDRITWLSNWDRDDENLTYSLYRNDKGANTPIYTTTGVSQFWNRPVLSYRDSGLTAGQTYQYWIKVSDPSGNTVRSGTVSVTMPSNFTLSTYANDVLALNPAHYWRLDGSSGTTTATDWGGVDDLSEGSGVSNGAPGAIIGDSDTAANFDGSAQGVAAAQTSEPGPNVFSVGAWVKTTTTSGGKIVGFGNANSGSSSSYDRHIYMDNAGHLIFGVYNGGSYTVVSPNTYNDGQWHQVVGTLSSSGMALYVDGKRVGVNPGTTQAQSYAGYWRVGGDNLNGWPSRPSSDDFAGSIDEVAVYSSALTLQQVQQQYTDSGRTLDQAPAPTDSYGKAVYQDSPDVYFRMDDSSGPTAVDTSPNNVPGTYSGGETFQVPSPVSGATGTAVTFNGSDGTLSTGTAVPGPTTYSAELWFNTTTTSGGKLIGFGNTQSGLSNNYDRQVYMTNSGNLVFGAYPNQAVTISSPKSYNDGAWHYLVATQGADGMNLYVDGSLVASNGNAGAQSYTGYWRIGGDNLNSWPSQPSSAYFSGTIDEVAVYGTELTPAQVLNHYKASPASGNNPPTASFTQSCTNLTCSFDGTGSSDSDGSVAGYAWNFGDGSTDTVAKPSHTFASPGTYTVTLTVTDNQGATGTTSQPVTVAATTMYAADAFGRTVTNGWGSADTGGSYTLAGAAARFSVKNGVGGMNLNAPGASPTAFLNGVSATDTNMLLDMSSDAQGTGNGIFMTMIARHTSSGDYRLKVRLLPGGVVHLALSKVVSGKETAFKEIVVGGLTYHTGDILRVRFVVSGTGTAALSGKIWDATGTEPANPQISATDSTATLQSPGGIGINSYLAGNSTNAPVNVSYDNLTVEKA